MPERLSVILLEGAYLLQSGLQHLLAEFPGMKVNAVFDGSEKKLAQKIHAHKPDFLFVDPSTTGIELIPFLREIESVAGVQVVGLINRETPANVSSRFAHVLKLYECKYELMEQLRTLLGERMVKEDRMKDSKGLSEREKTILKEIVLGLTNQEIADKLYLSIHTVTTHRKNLTNKLGIKTVSGLTVYALLNKIADIRDIE